MIIVSQDKETIVNFDNVMFIEIAADDKTIRCQFKDLNLWLGHYETIERTKEVFNEIIRWYKNFENLKVGQPEGFCTPIYEMPEK